MKFFTKELHNGEYSDDESQKIIDNYNHHLNQIASFFNEDQKKIAFDVSLNDALIEAIEINYKLENLTLSLLCGDLKNGYYELKIEYSSVNLNDLEITVLEDVISSKNSEVLYDEFDLKNDKKNIHRIMFWPNFNEVEIVFKIMKIDFYKRDSRVIKNLKRTINKIY